MSKNQKIITPFHYQRQSFELDLSWGRVPQWLRLYSYQYPNLIKWDGLDSAIVGLATSPFLPVVLVYDYNKMVKAKLKQYDPKLVKKNKEDTMLMAAEDIDYNTIGAYVGEYTPLAFYPYQEKEEWKCYESGCRSPRWQGYDDAIVGNGGRCGMEEVLVYDMNKMVEIVSYNKGTMSMKDVIDWINKKFMTLKKHQKNSPIMLYLPY